MKLFTAAAIALIGLTGCVAVPYAPEPYPAGYYYAPAPAATFNFGYTYRDGHGWYGPRHRHGYRYGH